MYTATIEFVNRLILKHLMKTADFKNFRIEYYLLHKNLFLFNAELSDYFVWSLSIWLNKGNTDETLCTLFFSEE